MDVSGDAQSPGEEDRHMAGVQRRMMRAAGALSVRIYRASGGRVMGRAAGVPVLLLTVAGRKTGVERTTLVSYFEDDGRFVVTGSAGGSASEPQWFRNLRRADRARIEVGRKRIDVAVAVAGPEEHTVLWERLLTHAPAFAKYQAKVERQIPMAVLTPTG
jgi:F420H(2)-dependent quinone reductase